MAATRCATCRAKLRSSDRFCPSCGARAGTGSAARVALQVAPRAQREEHRVATILFADVVGSTALGERLDAEGLREVMASFFRSVASEVQRHGGVVNNYMGDGLMAVFGAPVAHGDDAERAVHAAFALQREVARLSGDLLRGHGGRISLRIGINTGDVIAGELAGDVQSAYTVTGDAVNVAQRIQAGAPADAILIGADTLRLVAGVFEVGEAVRIAAKGKALPVAAHPVIRERERDRISTTPTVGREEELAVLRGAMSEAESGRGGVLLVIGDAGAGKTRLADDLRRSAAHIGPIRCASYRQVVPYSALGGLLRASFGLRLGDDELAGRAGIRRTCGRLGVELDAGAVELLLDLFGMRVTDLPSEMRPRALLSLVRKVLAGHAGSGPLLIVLDDVHWMDDASARLIAQIVPWLARQRILLVALARTGWSAPWAARTLEVGPLTATAARELAEGSLGAPIDDAASEAIAGRAQGNPLFIEEYARALGEAGGIALEHGTWRARAFDRVPVPGSLHELIAARLDRLPADERRLLHDAAILGRTFRGEILGQMTGAGERELAILASRGLIVRATAMGERVYAFVQELVRDVLYREQLGAQRRDGHARAAAAYADVHSESPDTVLDHLAHHYDLADDPRAAELLVRAGERAFRLNAHDEALGYLRRALDRGEDALLRARAHERTGDVHRATGRYPEALEAYARARDASADAVARARAAWKTAAVHRLASPKGVARDHVLAALAETPEIAHDERARARVVLGMVTMDEGRYDEAIAELGRAVADAERGRAEEVRAEAYKHIGTAHVLKGEPARGLAYYERALATYERIGNDVEVGNVINNIAVVHRRQARYDDALAAHRRALATRERIGDPLGIGTSRNNLGEVRLARGEVEAAEAEYGAAGEVWSSIAYDAGVALARVGLGACANAKGAHGAALDHLRAALSEWERLGMRVYVSETERHIAEAHLADDPRAAVAWAERAVATAASLGSADDEAKALRVLGRAYLATGDTARAADAIERARTSRTERGAA